MENKLALGTAQLGLKYGIANREGIPERGEALEILKTAVDAGIRVFDTAYMYGESEEVIGEFLKSNTCEINLISKMPHLSGEISEKAVRGYFDESLKRLAQKRIYSYMIHSTKDLVADRKGIIAGIMKEWKKEGRIQKIGVSVYDREEINFLRTHFGFDLIQIPLNIFDQRLIKDGTLTELKKRNCEIHARSIFLQGVVFLSRDDLPPHLKGLLSCLEKLDFFARKTGFSSEEIALLYVYLLPGIDKVVIGVEKKSQLLNNLSIINKSISFRDALKSIDISLLGVNEPSLVDPRKW